jgi:hypothetical protein
LLVNTPPSTNNFDVGLQNKNSASERIAASRATADRLAQNNAQRQNLNSDGFAELGLQDRGVSSERIAAVQSLKGRVIENHGFDAKQAIKQALTNNTKIINTPPLERGSLLDIRI